MAHFIFCCIVAFMFYLTELHSFVGAQGVGVNYGQTADNLPPEDQVVSLMKSKNIKRVRIFNPNSKALEALKGSGIQVIVGTVNEDVKKLAEDSGFAASWVENNIKPYGDVSFRCISVGNERVPSDSASYIVSAMENLKNALIAANLNIPVSTAVFQNVLTNSYPPSAGTWHPDAKPFMVPIVQFLEANKYPLLCNLYTYFAYRDNTDHIRLDYALINTTDVVVQDGNLGYTNLLDASIDAVYAALEKTGAGNVEILLTETGWPSDGLKGKATVSNAQTYVNNLISHVISNAGTPKRPGKGIETYIFALFNENQKPDGTEQHWGLFYPDMKEVYPVNFPA